LIQVQNSATKIERLFSAILERSLKELHMSYDCFLSKGEFQGGLIEDLFSLSTARYQIDHMVVF
jgi:hypothetical protein